MMALQAGARTFQAFAANGHARRPTKEIGLSYPSFLRSL